MRGSRLRVAGLGVSQRASRRVIGWRTVSNMRRVIRAQAAEGSRLETLTYAIAEG